MACEEVDLVKAGNGPGLDPAGLHEPHGAVDLVGQLFVAAALRAGGHELLVPLVHAGQVGETALGEGAQQVQRGRRLVIRLQQSSGIGRSGLGVEADVVDHVAAEAREFDVVEHLGVRGAGLGELSGDASDLHGRDTGGVGEHHSHLKDHPQTLADRVRGERLEGLRAVAGLQQERLAVRDPSEICGQGTGLTGEDQRREGGEVLENGVQLGLVGPCRLLERRAGTPRIRCPGGPWGVGHDAKGTSAPMLRRSRFGFRGPPGAVLSSRWIWS